MFETARPATLRLLHYWWPLALGWSITVVVQRATARSVDPFGMVALLSGIFAAYSLDRVFDSSSSEERVWERRVLATSGVIAAIACGVAACWIPLRTALLIPVLGAAALCYPRLKQLTLTKTVALPIVWTWASMALPFNDTSWLGWHWLTMPVAAPLLLLIASGCVLCDLKDEQADRLAGVRSLPAVVGSIATLRVAVALALAAGGLALAEHRTAIAVSAAVLGVATMLPAVLATDATGPLLVDMILTLPGILISARLV